MKRALCILLIALPVTACAIGEARYESESYPIRVASAEKTCSSGFIKPDLSKLEACGEGQGHCYATDKLQVDGYPACKTAGEACIPDKILQAGGTKMKSCKFLIDDKPGACTSTLIGLISAHKDQLTPDVCDAATERCAPCIDPTNQKNTHLCEDTGVHEEACKGGPGQVEQTCCHGAGVCMNPEAAPEDQRDSLQHDSCGTKKVCAPAALVDGNPTRCYVLGLPGVCLDVCFASMLGPSKPVTGSSDCRATEVCLPCVIGKGQGIPGC